MRTKSAAFPFFPRLAHPFPDPSPRSAAWLTLAPPSFPPPSLLILVLMAFDFIFSSYLKFGFQGWILSGLSGRRVNNRLPGDAFSYRLEAETGERFLRWISRVPGPADLHVKTR